MGGARPAALRPASVCTTQGVPDVRPPFGPLGDPAGIISGFTLLEQRPVMCTPHCCRVHHPGSLVDTGKHRLYKHSSRPPWRLRPAPHTVVPPPRTPHLAVSGAVEVQPGTAQQRSRGDMGLWSRGLPSGPLGPHVLSTGLTPRSLIATALERGVPSPGSPCPQGHPQGPPRAAASPPEASGMFAASPSLPFRPWLLPPPRRSGV